MNLNNGNPDCPLCRGKGEYHIGGSFGGGTTTHKCNCKNFGISPGIDPGNDKQLKPTVENVGEEFIKWSEQYWRLNVLISKGIESESANGESCSYSYIRGVFIKKINELADNKHHYNLNENESRKLKELNSTTVKFENGNGIGMVVKCLNQNNEWIDITDYNKW
jgi:hypothetical protein